MLYKKGLLIISYIFLIREGVSGLSAGYKAEVRAVVDGDTVRVEFIGDLPRGVNRVERLRLIGVDTPELSGNEEYAVEARDFTNRTLYRRVVSIVFDNTLRDKYGRLLGYIWVGGILFNELLIREGYGKYYDNFPFNAAYMSSFKMAEYEAKRDKKNIWSRR